MDTSDLSFGLHLAFHPLESVRELLKKIFDDALVVVAPAENVIER
jgi:hypothetical protein